MKTRPRPRPITTTTLTTITTITSTTIMKGFTDEPEALTRGFGKVEKVLKALQVCSRQIK